jgi:hypothetical protein
MHCWRILLLAFITARSLAAAELSRERQVIGDSHFRQGLILWEPKPGQRISYGQVPGVDE